MFSTRHTFASLTTLSLLCTASSALAVDPAQDGAWTDGLYGGVALGAVMPKDSSASGTSGGTVNFENGMSGSAFVGSKLGDNLRLELELNQRQMDLDSIAGTSASGDAQASALMGNAMMDLDFDLPVTPYIGAGVGVARLNINNGSPFGGSSIDDSDTATALQGIAGASYALNENLDVFADYRYFTTGDGDFTTAAGTNSSFDLTSHNVMAGLRLNFGDLFSSGSMSARASDASGSDASAQAEQARETAMTEATKTPHAPAHTPSHTPSHTMAETFLVNFEFNKADITEDGIAVIEGVVHAVKTANVTRLVLTGHTDTMGSQEYNQKLSVRRAEAVKTALLALGFEAENIRVVGKGETELLVPTPDNTYEPKNRRVEIVLP